MFKQKPIKPISVKRALLLAIPAIVVVASFLVYFERPKTVEAATNATVNFQARLLSASGSIVPDGFYNVEFKIYTAAAADGGETPDQGACTVNGGTADEDCEWVETRTSGNRVRTVNGYLTVNLASVTAFSSIDWDQELWLSMNIGGTAGSPSWDGEMTPRLKLTAVPYAFRAGALAGGTGANTTVLTTGTPSGNNTLQLPAESGILCVQSSVSCGFLTGAATDYIQNGTSLQTTANFYIQSAANNAVGGIIRGHATQTSSLFQLLDGSSGLTVAQFTNNGYLHLGSDSISRTGQIVFHDGTLSNTNTITLIAPTAVASSSKTITLPDETGTLCIQSSTSCGFATGSGDGDYIQNGTTVQTNANFAIRSAATGSVGAVVQGASGQTADLLQLQSWNGSTATTVFSVNNSGVVTLAGGQTRDITTADAATSTAMVLQPGISSGATTTGAAVSLRGGDVSGTTTVTGGAVTIQGGNATGGSGSRTGGAVTIDGGSGATAAGAINIGTANAPTINIGSVGSTAKATAINIGTSTTTTASMTQTVTIGSAANLGHTVTVQGGNSNTQAILLTTHTSGGIMIGSSTATGTITLGRSTATNTVSIGSATPGASSTQTISIGNGSMSNATSSIVVNVLSGTAGTNGTGQLNLANNDRVTQVDIGNVVADAARTLNVFTGNSTTVDTINIGTGNTTAAGGKTINIGSGTPSGSGTNLITIGATANASATTVQAGTGGLNLGTGGVANTIQLGNTTGAVAQIINLGTNATGSSTNTVNIGTTSTSSSAITISGGTGASNNITLQTNNSSSGVLARSVTNSTAAFRVQNTGNQNLLQVDTSNSVTVLGQASLQGNLRFSDGGAGGFGLSMLATGLQGLGTNRAITWNASSLTADRSYTLPDANGTLCLQGSASCGFATGAAGDFIQNQTASQQASSNFWISGTGRADTALTTPRLDTAVAGALTIGDTNATSILIGKSNTSNIQTAIYGQTLSKATVDSTTIFRVQNAQGNTVINVDTTSPNLITNSSFESAGTTGWSAHNGSTISQSVLAHYDNDASLDIDASATGHGARFAYPLAVGPAYSLSFFVRASTGDFSTLQIGYSSDGSTDTQCATAQSAITSRWARITCSNFTLGSTSGSPYVYIKQTDGASREWWIDAVQLEAATAPTPYRNGKVSINNSLVINGGPLDAAASTAALQVKALTGGDGVKINGSGENNIFNSMLDIRSADDSISFMSVNETSRMTQVQGGSGFFNTAALHAIAIDGGSTALRVRSGSGQTADIFQVQTWNGSTATTVVSVGNTGVLSAGVGMSTGTASATTGTIAFRGSGGAGILTLQGPATPNASNYTLSLPAITGNATVCTDNTVCTGYAPASGSANYIQNTTTVQTSANFAVRSAATGSIGGVIQGASGQTADIFRVQSWNGTVASTLLSVGNTGLVTSNGAIRLSGGASVVDTYVTPTGANIGSMINIPNYNPGSFGQLIAMGLPSGADSTSRAISLLDARTVTHQPTLAVFSPNENEVGGFSWDGSNTSFRVKNSVAGNIALNVAGTDRLVATTAGAELTGNLAATAASTWATNAGNLTIQAATTNTLALNTVGAGIVALGNTNTTTIDIGRGSDIARTIRIGDAGSSTTQAITIGSTNGSSSTTIRGGTGATAVNLTSGTNGSVNLTTAGTGDINLTSTDNIIARATTSFQVQAAGAEVLQQINATGQTVFQNSTDSDQAFRINTSAGAGGNAVFRVDTSTQKVSIGLSSGTTPAKLYVTTGTEVGFRVNTSGANTNNIFEAARSTVNVMSIASEGATLFKNSTDSTAAFQVQRNNADIMLNMDTTNNRIIVGNATASSGTDTTLFVVDSATTANRPTGQVGALYFDSTVGRIQCYESDGWGSCGSAPDNIIILTPEFSGATLNGSGIGTMTSDFCAQQASVLNVNTSLCATGVARNFYKWTSPQSSQQIYSIYVSYKLPTTFANFADNNTIQLTGRTDNTTNGIVTYELFKSTGSTITACGTETTVTSTVNTWQTVSHNGNENTTCAFGGGNTMIVKINVKAEDNANVYVGELTFTYTNN
jgi:hypothetical protein